MGAGGGGEDWAAWEAVPLPVDRLNFWDEPFAELYDWYPWLRRFYTKMEMEYDCLPVRVDKRILLTRLCVLNKIDDLPCTTMPSGRAREIRP